MIPVGWNRCEKALLDGLKDTHFFALRVVSFPHWFQTYDGTSIMFSFQWDPNSVDSKLKPVQAYLLGTMRNKTMQHT